jgi:sugar/nucleoside kinase (ribokinase family)
MSHTLRVRPQRLVLVGSVLVDVLMYVDRLPARGGDILAHHSLFTSGGGFNVLSAAKRLGLQTAYAGRVGDGPMGTQVMHDLQAEAIPLLLARAQGEDTGFDVALIEQNAEHTFVTSPGVESKLRPDDLQTLTIQANDVLYISGYELCYPISGPALEQWLPTLTPEALLFIDPGPLVADIPASRLARVLARTDILSLNAHEAAMLTGKIQLGDAAQALLPRLAPEAWVVARDSAQGCWIASSNYAPRHIKPRPTQAVDTTGAGDAHTAALLTRLAAGDDISMAAQTANIAASLSVERSGPATGPTAHELERATN